MDGTIINTEHKWVSATADYVKRHRPVDEVEKNYSFIESLSGAGIYKYVDEVKKKFKMAESVKTMVKGIKEIAEGEFSQIDFISGFHDFQKTLSEHSVKRSIATNCDETSFQSLIKRCGFDKMFGQHLYCADHVGHRPKPDPAVFLHAADKLGEKPKDCIVFEDSIYGFRAAKAAGMRCIAIKNHKNVDFLSMADGHIEHYDDAKSALHKLCDQIESKAAL